jgi:hypothetical protein
VAGAGGARSPGGARVDLAASNEADEAVLAVTGVGQFG